MRDLAVLTPTYRPDLASVLVLHQSVLRHTAPSVLHHLVVPQSDLSLFRAHATPRMRVHSVRDFLPRSFLSTYVSSTRLRQNPVLAFALKVQAVNLRHPWPPVRGWILQQIVKLAATTELGAEVVLVADSDIALIQRVDGDTLSRGSALRFYRAPEAVTPSMLQHQDWHRAAERLLGLPPDDAPSKADYIAPFLAWDSSVIEDMRRRIEQTKGKDWRSAVAASPAFSECILYGRYVDQLADPVARSWTSDNDLCETYWGPGPLRTEDVDGWLGDLSSETLAVCIQSTSGTTAAVRQRTITDAEQRLHAR
jgi:hypothetical protein